MSLAVWPVECSSIYKIGHVCEVLERDGVERGPPPRAISESRAAVWGGACTLMILGRKTRLSAAAIEVFLL